MIDLNLPGDTSVVAARKDKHRIKHLLTSSSSKEIFDEDDDTRVSKLDSISSTPRNIPSLMNLRSSSVSITHLDLSHFCLHRIPHDVFTIKNLKTLDLSHNEITALDIPKNPLSSLESLCLDFNDLFLDDKTLECIGKSFPGLVRLSLCHQESTAGRNCSIKEIDLPNKIFPYLRYFNVSCNEMRSIQVIKGNDSLEKLVLHSNALQELPCFLFCPNLSILDVSNNCLIEVTNFSSLMHQLPLLRSVDFSGNSSRFHFKSLPVNCPSKKPLDLVKVEPYSDLCRVAFSNCLLEKRLVDESYVFISNLHSSSPGSLSPSTVTPSPSPSSSSNSSSLSSSSLSATTTSPSTKTTITTDPNQLIILMVYGVTVNSVTRKVLAQLLVNKSSPFSSDTEMNESQREKKHRENLLSTFYCICEELGIQLHDKIYNNDKKSTFNIILCHMTLTDCTRIRAEYVCWGEDVSVSLLDTTSRRDETSLNNESYLGSYKRHVTDLLKGHRHRNKGENDGEVGVSSVSLLSSPSAKNNTNTSNNTPYSLSNTSLALKPASHSSPLFHCPEQQEADDDGNSLRQMQGKIIMMTGRVDLMERNTILFLGVKVNEDSKKRLEEDPFRVFFKQNESLDKKLRVFSENVKCMQTDGHFVMALQPNFDDDHLPQHHDAGLDFPEKYKSWDYILQENDVKEKITSSSSSSSTAPVNKNVSSSHPVSSSSTSCLEDKIIPVVKKTSVMMSEYTLSALRVQRDYIESSPGNAYMQLFRI